MQNHHQIGGKSKCCSYPQEGGWCVCFDGILGTMGQGHPVASIKEGWPTTEYQAPKVKTGTVRMCYLCHYKNKKSLRYWDSTSYVLSTPKTWRGDWKIHDMNSFIQLLITWEFSHFFSRIFSYYLTIYMYMYLILL